jgi:hypothetical protein
LFEAPAEVGSGSPARTFRAKSVIGIGVPAAYVSPVTGFRTATARIPWRCNGVGIVWNATLLRVWRNPS